MPYLSASHTHLQIKYLYKIVNSNNLNICTKILGDIYVWLNMKFNFKLKKKKSYMVHKDVINAFLQTLQTIKFV